MTRAEKMKVAKDAKKDEYSKQIVKIDDVWTVLRADERNWLITRKGKEWGFFGTFQDALAALPAKMLGDEVKNSLADVLGSVKGIRERIERAFNPKW